MNSQIPAILILSGNKTYGRQIKDSHQSTGNSRKLGNLLYRCIPNDHSIEPFVVPYKSPLSEFSKSPANMYIVAGVNVKGEMFIVETIGRVDDFSSFCRYKLICANILDTTKYNSLKATARERVKQRIVDSSSPRGTITIFTIDPKGCTDYDDAFSVSRADSGSIHPNTNTNTIVSIYISNVPYYLSVLDLWENLSNRVSTIYLPDPLNKIPMLPPILSDGILSLKEGCNTVAFILDLEIDKDITITSLRFRTDAINVSKNYVYEEQSLLNCPDYQYLKMVAETLNKVKGATPESSTSFITEVADSHHVVEYFMVFMNKICGNILAVNGTGIFRKADIAERKSLTPMMTDSFKAEYTTNNTDNEHSGIGITNYAHITSPIRRIVDILNMVKIQTTCMTIYTESCAASLLSRGSEFYDMWTTCENINYINDSVLAIKKIQNHCKLLSIAPTCLTNQQQYTGICMEVHPQSHQHKGLNVVKYTVYIQDLGVYTSVLSDQEMIVGETSVFKMVLLTHEHSFYNKVKFSICSS